ncbi:dihydrofolate reductase family protein [Stappia indica]|uniref:Dihydrofolate reductase n=1 Tax=Stappia indica TaxID=538381 RepID=A0A285S7N4_9HYPH|nr:dihydrofolate reductase family protein [Stappia indica]SOC03539.1 Dihydrofolate reductase [Stappia indica]
MSCRIIVTQYISLDGIIEDPVGMEASGLGDWTGPFSRGPEGDRLKHEELFAASALLLGRRTYEAFAAVWPQVTDDTGFAARINTLPKHVVSGTLASGTWAQTSILQGDAVRQVAALKARSDGDLLVYGSAALLHALIPAGLVDDYRLMVYPVILGRGKTLFPQGAEVRLRLRQVRPLNDGIVWMEYAAAA